MCWVRQVSPTLPPPSLAGPAHPGPFPLHARRTLTPHLSSHVLDTGQVPHQSRGLGGAAQGAWCWPGGHVTRSSLEREGRPRLPSLFTGRDCAVPFCLCNINTDFYTSPLCLPVLSIPVLGFPLLSPLGGLGFLGDPADHGPPLSRSQLPAPQYQSCLPGHPLEMKVGSRWKPFPCHPGSLCQAGGLAASLTWPLGLGHYPEDSGALRVSRLARRALPEPQPPPCQVPLVHGGHWLSGRPWEKPWNPASVSLERPAVQVGV